MKIMLCRLCLTTIETSNEVLLYKTEEATHNPNEYVSLIEKYLQLKIPWDDPTSNKICNECGQVLKDFDVFYKTVEEKQNSLKNEFLSVKSDADWLSAEEDYDNPFPGEGLMDYDDTDEDFKDGIRLKNEKSPSEAFCERDILEEQEIKIEDFFLSDHENDRDINEKPSDDEIPLINLKQKLKSSESFGRKTKVKEKPPRRKTKKDSSKKPKEKKGSFNQTEVIKQNEEIIASHMKLICDLCSTQCESFAKLRTHFWEVHNEKNAYVKCCNNKYGKPSKLVVHVKWHQNPQAFKCKICNKQLKGQNCLDAHMSTKHKESLSLPTEQKNEDHFACTECPRKFRMEACLKKHIEKHKNGSVKDFNCDLCGKSFINIHRLKRHIEAIHEDLHPYVCDMCGKKFKFKPSFDKHILEHQGIVEKPVQCEDCGRWLKNNHSYRWHRFSHVKQEVACTLCGKVCPSKNALRGHMNYMHREKPLLQCKYCEKSFKEKKNYNEHLAVHTRALLYSCQYCSKEFRSKANMYAHVKRNHVTEWEDAKMAKSYDPNYKKPIDDT